MIARMSLIGAARSAIDAAHSSRMTAPTSRVCEYRKWPLSNVRGSHAKSAVETKGRTPGPVAASRKWRDKVQRPLRVLTLGWCGDLK